MGSNEVQEFYEDPESLEERFPKTRKRSRRLAAVNLHYCFANGASYLHGHLTTLLKRGCRGKILPVAVYHLPEFRYYYAVFEFDSIAAADLIYLLMNGSHGPIVFDLRFIADSVEFNHQPHVIATTPAEPEPESLALRGSGRGNVEDDNVVEKGDGGKDNQNMAVTYTKNLNACIKGFALDSTDQPKKSTETYSRKVVLKKQKFAETEPGEMLNCNVARN